MRNINVVAKKWPEMVSKQPTHWVVLFVSNQSLVEYWAIFKFGACLNISLRGQVVIAIRSNPIPFEKFKLSGVQFPSQEPDFFFLRSNQFLSIIYDNSGYMHPKSGV